MILSKAQLIKLISLHGLLSYNLSDIEEARERTYKEYLKLTKG